MIPILHVEGGWPTPRSGHGLCAWRHALRKLPSDEKDGKESESKPEGHSKIVEDAHLDGITKMQILLRAELERRGGQKVGDRSLIAGDYRCVETRRRSWELWLAG